MFAFHRHDTGRDKRGFTLIEMAIVLGVAGILFGGLWRLLSNGNSQMRDQATAAQQAQLIGAVSAYLQSAGNANSTTGGGQGFLRNLGPGPGPGAAYILPLPGSANPAGSTNCAANLPNDPGLCVFLPVGFSSSTTNPYGQTYSIGVLKDASAAGTAPQTYSFMIITSGGDTISDTSGGRIAAMIGGDGGFVYSSNVCGTATQNACGAFGAWSTLLSYYIGGTNGPSVTVNGGQVASRTYYSPTQNLSSTWLSRTLLQGDTSTPPLYNTMQTALYLGSNGGATNIFYLGDDANANGTTGGTIYMQGGLISAAGSGGGTIDIGTVGLLRGEAASIGGGAISLAANMNSTNANAVLQMTAGCTVISAPNCQPVAQISGDVKVVGLLTSTNLSANEFVYTGSDIRLKTNIAALPHALDDLMKLKPVSFTYKASGKEAMGFIAQDVEKIYPQLVINNANGMKAVGYDGLIAPLVEAVQELKKENEELREELRVQAAQQDRLTQQMKRLQNP